ncbi:unnamed protein product, partial [Larinioides sclopetarius]
SRARIKHHLRSCSSTTETESCFDFNLIWINFGYFCGLLLCFYFTKTTKTLMSTGESSTKNSLFHRYLMTVRHVQKWSEGDVWDANDSAH